MSREPIRLVDLDEVPSPEADVVRGLIRAQRGVRPPEGKIDELVARLEPAFEAKRPPLNRAVPWLAASVAVLAAIVTLKLSVTPAAPVESNATSPATVAPEPRPREEAAPAPSSAGETASSAQGLPVSALPSINPRKVQSAPRCDEVAIVDAADVALRSGNPERALAATREHEQRCGAGEFVQERERIAIEALAKLGRLDQARDRATVFEKSFPTSAHLRRVRQVVE